MSGTYPKATMDKQRPTATPLRVIFEGELPEGVGNTLCLTMTLDGTDIPVTLSAADKSSVEEAGFYAVTESDGGLLAVPRIENGELVVSIHPLNEGKVQHLFLSQPGVWKGYGGPDQPVTVVSPDGAVWKGNRPLTIPSVGTPIWTGISPSPAGKLYLHIPYVHQYPAADKRREAQRQSWMGTAAALVRVFPARRQADVWGAGPNFRRDRIL